MSLELPYGGKRTTAGPWDEYYGPYADVAAAKAAVPESVRYDGLTVKITGKGEYHWLSLDLSDDGLRSKTIPNISDTGQVYGLNISDGASNGTFYTDGSETSIVQGDSSTGASGMQMYNTSLFLTSRNPSNTVRTSLTLTKDNVTLELGSDATGDTYHRNSSGYLTRRGVITATSTATLTVNSDTTYQSCLTAQAEALTIANPTGTPFNGQDLVVRVKDNGTARAITFGAQFRAIGTALPTTTTISKTLYICALWNAADSKWDTVNHLQV